MVEGRGCCGVSGRWKGDSEEDEGRIGLGGVVGVHCIALQGAEGLNGIALHNVV
jgi:hypothetical protein